jgi:hypothetical protein
MSFCSLKKWDNDELLVIILWKHQQLQKKTLSRQHELKKKGIVFVEAPTTKIKIKKRVKAYLEAADETLVASHFSRCSSNCWSSSCSSSLLKLKLSNLKMF